MKLVQQEYYFSRPKINSLYSPDSRFKSISHYSDKSLVQNIDTQIQINQVIQNIQYLKGKINYEKSQLQQLSFLNSDTNFSFTSVPLSKLDPESYTMKQKIVQLKEQLKQLENEEKRIQMMNYQRIDQNEEYAFKNYTRIMMMNKSKQQLIQHKTGLINQIKQLKHEIYIDQMEINVQDHQILDLETKNKQYKIRSSKVSEQLKQIKKNLAKYQQFDLKKSRQIKDFMSKLGVGDSKADDMDEVLENYNRKILNNQKSIDEFLLIAQQRSYYALSQMQDLEYQIKNQKEVKSEIFSQIRELKLLISKFSKTRSTSLENNYNRDNLKEEEKVDWIFNSRDLDEFPLTQSKIIDDVEFDY
ncbi:unnamed protein product (macronuclear) [Paramecium tetraurelia]|uniref:Uncharacterized protein n=1 Tax=Paramecium tetraurelia TaxID=5888 RepID=A0CJT3_PARTE|nr:uncharacterized protein GSPATT00000762001 [Paramecium tetraurelia]CAK71050.1 unnamed protein product [Paramecium tetraurelia]|eukprot:XP_001438447.1 hypothetical protein (macronuclear) [Paramecium tetraurelia strain d4-2]